MHKRIVRIRDQLERNIEVADESVLRVFLKRNVKYWQEQEHQLFVEAVKKEGFDVYRIAGIVKTKTPDQIKKHIELFKR